MLTHDDMMKQIKLAAEELVTWAQEVCRQQFRPTPSENFQNTQPPNSTDVSKLYTKFRFEQGRTRKSSKQRQTVRQGQRTTLKTKKPQ